MTRQRKAAAARAGAGAVPSKDLPPLPDNFGPVFFKNQFRTKIPLPTKEKFPDVQGQCAIITGANTGLGFSAAKQLLELGLSRLVVAVRTVQKGLYAAKQLQHANPNAKIDVWPLDMQSYDSVQAFVRKCDAELPRIDTVILNAGVAPFAFHTVERTGHEESLQVNHWSTALLSILLLPVLKRKRLANASPTPPTLVAVNSVMAHLAKMAKKDQRPLLHSFDERYGESKLVSQLFLVELANRVSPEDVTIVMVDPGMTKGTGLSRDVTGMMAVAARAFNGIAGRPVERGSATYVDAAYGHGKETHGCFLMNCEIAPFARIYYSDGTALTQAIWSETMQELSEFVDAEGVIESLRSI
ncbi:putative short-chain dehydrogenase/reductase family protein [Daedaleopsis nitida]|nr:putative short-chain dehydrogenase/reductase family protein [Daedaleopsis nitida]